MKRVVCLALLVLGVGGYMFLPANGGSSAQVATDPVYFAGERIGSINDLAALKAKLISIREQREKSNARLGPDGDIIYIKLAPTTTISSLVQLTKAFTQPMAGYEISLWEDHLVVPNAASDHKPRDPKDPRIVVGTDPDASIADGDLTFHVEPFAVTSAVDLKTVRVAHSGIEIDDAGKYVYNDRGPDHGPGIRPNVNANFGGNKRLAAFTFTQRPIERADLKNAVYDLFDVIEKETASDDRKLGIKPRSTMSSSPTLQVIVGEKTTWAQVLPILELNYQMLSVALVVRGGK